MTLPWLNMILQVIPVKKYIQYLNRSSVMGMLEEQIMSLSTGNYVCVASTYIHRYNVTLRVLYYHLHDIHGIDKALMLLYAPSNIEYIVGNKWARIYWNYSCSILSLLQINEPDVLFLDYQKKRCISSSCRLRFVLTSREKNTKNRQYIRMSSAGYIRTIMWSLCF